MAYPTQDQIKLPLLEAIGRRGGNIRFSILGDEIEHELANHFGLSEEQRNETRPHLRIKGKRVWRLNIQWARKKLVDDGLLDGSTHDVWALTNNGWEQIRRIAESDDAYKTRETELLEDDPRLVNETRNVVTKRIVRYKQIVDHLKRQYNNRCQVEGCNFTFQKKDGSYYSEGHHLIPLSDGGTQEARNVVILCANHHRMMHYANVEIGELSNGKRNIKLNGDKHVIIYKLL